MSGRPGDDLGPTSRRVQLERRLSRALSASPEIAERYRTDVATRLQVTTMRRAVLSMDEAMAAEGVALEARDRVLHRVIVGEEPLPDDGEAFDPDRDIGPAMRARASREAMLRRYLASLMS